MSAEKVTNRSLVILAYASLFIMGFVDNLRSPYFSSVLSDLSLDDVHGAFFFIVPACFAFLGSFLSPLWTQRLSIRYALLIITIFLCFGFGLLPFAENYWGLLILAAIYGLGLGTSNVAQNVGVQEGSSLKMRRRLIGGLHSMYALASFFAPFIATWLLQEGVGWRLSFRITAIVCAVLYSILFFLSQNNRRRTTTHQEKKIKGPSPKRLEMLLVTMPSAFYLIGEMSLSTRLALYLERELGFAKEKASFWLALFFAFFTVGRLLCWLLDTQHWSQVKILTWSSSLALVFYSLGLLISPVFFIFCGLVMAPFFPTAMDWFGSIYHEHVDRALAIGLAFGYFITLSMHFILGQLSENFGLAKALWFGPFGLLITIASLRLSLKMLGQK